MRTMKQWKYKDLEKALSSKNPISEIAQAIGRTVSSVRVIQSLLKAYTKDPTAHYISTSMKELLRQYTQNHISDVEAVRATEQVTNEQSPIDALAKAFANIEMMVVAVIDSEVKKRTQERVFEVEKRAEDDIRKAEQWAQEQVNLINDELMELRQFKEAAKKSNFGTMLKSVLG